MGGWMSHVWWGGDPDAAHPVSGLSRRDVHAVQRSWAPVYKQALPNGIELLKRLFRAYPETREFFTTLRKLPEEEYAESPQFKAHTINLMSALNMAIVNLHQPEVVAVMMQKIGDSHNKRKIRKRHFEEIVDKGTAIQNYAYLTTRAYYACLGNPQGFTQDLKKVLVQMFVEVLKLNDATMAAWARTVDFLYKPLFDRLEDDSR